MQPRTSSHAQLLHKKLDADFKLHHLAVIDAVVDDEASHDDVRLETLLTIPALTLTSDIRSIAERRLDQLDARLSLANTAVSRLTSAPTDLHYYG